MARLTSLIVACIHITSCGSLVRGGPLWQGPGQGTAPEELGAVQGRRLLQGISCPLYPNYDLFEGQDHSGDDIRCGLEDTDAAQAACNANPLCLAFNGGCIKEAKGDLVMFEGNCYYERKGCPGGPGHGWCKGPGDTSYQADCNGDGSALDNICIAATGDRGVRLWNASCTYPALDEYLWRQGSNNADPNWPNATIQSCPVLFSPSNATCPLYANYDLTVGVDHLGDNLKCNFNNIDAAEAACNGDALCLAFNHNCTKGAKGKPTKVKDATFCYYERKGCPGDGWCKDPGDASYQADCNGNGSELDNVCIAATGNRGVRLWNAGCSSQTSNPNLWLTGSNNADPNWPNASNLSCPILFSPSNATCPLYANYDLTVGFDHLGDNLICNFDNIDAAKTACNGDALCLAFNHNCTKGAKGKLTNVSNATFCYYERKGCLGGPGHGWCKDPGETSYQADCNGDGSALDNVCIAAYGDRGVRLWNAGCDYPALDEYLWRQGSNNADPNWPNASNESCPVLFSPSTPPSSPPAPVGSPPPTPAPVGNPPPAPVPVGSPPPAPTQAPISSPSPAPVPIGSPAPAPAPVVNFPPTLAPDDVSPPLQATSTPSNTGIIAGVVIGCVALILLVCGVTWWMCKSRRAARDGTSPGNSADVECIVLPGQQPKPQRPAGRGIARNTAEQTDSSSGVVTGSGVAGNSSGVIAKTDDYKVDLLKSMNIPWKSITIGKVLGAGGFGTVVRGDWTGNPVAVKMLNVEKLSDSVRNSLRQEALAMCALRHPCIAHMYGVVDEGNHQALVMRYYEMGTVAAAISMDGFYSKLDLLERLRMARQVATGMCYLHTRKPTPMIHGDLKTTNLLIEKNNKHRGVVITDFGLCGLGQVAESGALTVTISPPEVLLDQRAPRTMAGDVYAFGIVLLEILSGTLVYQGMRSDQVRQAVTKGLRPGLSQVPDNIASLIKDCWAQEAATRPTFVEVEHRLQEAIQALEKEKQREEESTAADEHSTNGPAAGETNTVSITDIYAWTATRSTTSRAPRLH